jgi:hypothetical protein
MDAAFGEIQKILIAGSVYAQDYLGLRQRRRSVARYFGSRFLVRPIGNVYGVSDSAFNLDVCAQPHQFASIRREQ